MDYSSAFNTISPIKLVNKLQTLGLGVLLCHWIESFLCNRPHHVRFDHHCSQNIIVSTEVPQGCVLSSALYSLFTYDCTSSHNSNTLIKFADDTTIVGLITGNNETAYREEVQILTTLCKDNDLILNKKKTKRNHNRFQEKQKKTSHNGLCITVFYDRYDNFFNTSNNFPKLLTHQHTYNTQLTKQLISCSKSHILN